MVEMCPGCDRHAVLVLCPCGCEQRMCAVCVKDSGEGILAPDEIVRALYAVAEAAAAVEASAIDEGHPSLVCVSSSHVLDLRGALDRLRAL